MYYGLMDTKRNPVAFHKEYRIIEKYNEMYYKTNGIELIPFKVKRKKLKKYKDYEDLYLVRYGDTYIQSMYLYTRQLDIDPLLDDLYYTHDVIIRVIEFTDNRERVKKLSEALYVIDDEIERLKKEVPTLDELKERHHHYEMYLYKNYKGE